MIGALRYAVTGRRFNPKNLRDVKRSEQGRTQSRQMLRTARKQLDKDVSTFSPTTANEFVAFVSVLEQDYVEARALYNEFANIDPKDKMLVDIMAFIKALKTHITALTKSMGATLRTTTGANDRLRAFAEQKSKPMSANVARTMPQNVTRGQRSPKLAHTPTGAQSLQRVFQRQLPSTQARNPAVNRSMSNSASFGTFSTGGPYRGAQTQMSAFERATLNMNRQVMKRDQEFQEWQQDFWSKFAHQQGATGQKPGNGLGLSDVILGALGLKNIGRILGRGVRGIGKLLGGMGSLAKLGGTGVAIGVGALRDTKIFSEFEAKIESQWNRMVRGMSSRMESIRTKLGSQYDVVRAQFARSVDDLGAALRAQVQTLNKNIGVMKVSVLENLSSMTSTMGASLDSARVRVIDFTSGVSSTLENWNSKIGKTFGTTSTKITEYAGRLSTSFDNAASMLSNSAAKLTTKVLDPTLQTMQVWGAKISSIFNAIPNQIGSTLKSATALTSSAASSLWNGASIGKYLGRAGKIAGPVGDIIGGVTGAVNVKQNYGLIGRPTAKDRVGGALGGVAASGIPDVWGWLTGNEFRPGTEERSLRGLWENMTNTGNARRAETVAAALLRGERVSASDLGTDQAFLEMVIRRVNDLADHNRKNVSRDSWFGTGQLNAMATPRELAFLATGYGTDFLLKNSNGFSSFVKANNYAASQAETALRDYASSVQNGKTPGFVRRMHGDMGAFVNDVKTQYDGFKPTAYSTGGFLTAPVVGTSLGQNGGERVTLAEGAPEGVFPAVRDPSTGRLGVESHTVTTQGPVNLKTEKFGITFDGNSARDFAWSLIDAIKRYLPDAEGPSEGRGYSDARVGTAAGPATADVRSTVGANSNFIDQAARAKEDAALNSEIGAADSEIARLTQKLNSGNLTGNMETTVARQLAAAKSRRASLGQRQASIMRRRRSEDRVASALSQGHAPTADISGLGSLPGTDIQASNGTGLGSLSSTYEGKVGSANADNIGHAYGKYQFNSAKGGLQQFFKSNPDYASKFAGLSPGTPEFAAKWREIAAADPAGFGAAQDRAATDLWYKPAQDFGQNLGFKFNDRGVQESVFSGSIQHGGIKKIMSAAAATPGFANMSPADQIKAFYAARRDYVNGLSSLSPGEKQKQMNRYAKEEQNALTNYAGKEGVSLGSGINPKAATVADMQKIDAEIGQQLTGGRITDAYRTQLEGQRAGLQQHMLDLQKAEKSAQSPVGTTNPATAGGKALRISMGEEAWAKVDPRMRKIAEEMSLRSENGIEVFSGFRGAGEKNHNGQAFDFNVLDKNGKAIPQPYLSVNGKGDFPGATENFRAYEKAAQIGRLVQLKNYPELTNYFRTGSYFGGKMGQNYGANDSMHLDITKAQNGAMGAGSWETGLYDKYKGYFDKGSSPSQGLGSLEAQMAMAAKLDSLYPIATKGAQAKVDAEAAARYDASAAAAYKAEFRSSPLMKNRVGAESAEAMRARLPSRFEMNSISHMEDVEGASAPTYELPSRRDVPAASAPDKQATNMTTGNTGQQVAAAPMVDSIKNRSYDPEQVALLSNGLRTV